MSHAERAAELLERANPQSETARIAAAQVYATLALAEAVDGLEMPGEKPPEPIPYEQTKEGWSWAPAE